MADYTSTSYSTAGPGMVVYVMRVQEAPGRRVWDAFNKRASIRVRCNGSLHKAVEQLAERAGYKVARINRYERIMTPAGAAHIIAAHEEGRRP